MKASRTGFGTRRPLDRALISTPVQANISTGFKWVDCSFTYSPFTNASQCEHGAIRGLGWSDKEELLLITEDGTVRRYFGLHGDFTSFSLGNVRRFP